MLEDFFVFNIIVLSGVFFGIEQPEVSLVSGVFFLSGRFGLVNLIVPLPGQTEGTPDVWVFDLLAECPSTTALA